MKFTAAKLYKENKVIPIGLIPDEVNGNLTWQLNDADVLEYDRKTKQFTLEVYEFQNDDWELVDTLGHEAAYQAALNNGIIYE